MGDLKGLIPKGKFFNEIQACIKLFEKSPTPKKEIQKYVVIETDDPNHFLLLGIEVANSFQNVSDSASLSKCLLGYFLDGKQRLSLVCDPSGKILARSVLRLLVDDKNHPVLFQEKIYVADERFRSRNAFFFRHLCQR